MAETTMVTDVLAAVEAGVAALGREVRTGMETRPLATLAVGAGGGYLLGAGVSLGVVRFLLSATSRAMLTGIVAAAVKGAQADAH